MAKKRKAVNPRPAKSEDMKSSHDIEERFDDSEDDFHAERNKVLLDEGPAAKRRRRAIEQEAGLLPSDEEVLNYSEDDDGSEDAQSANNTDDSQAGEEEDGVNWGMTKADYYNNDVIETEADALEEEKEAKRLQQKQLQNMTEADFGFDEAAWAQPEQKTGSGPIVEKLPEMKIPRSASKNVMIDILYNRYPEFNLLARDLSELQQLWLQLQDKAVLPNGARSATRLKLDALTAYLGSIAMYFAVVTSRTDSESDETITALPPNVLHEHAVIENLTSSRQMWDMVKNLRERDVHVSSQSNGIVRPVNIVQKANSKSESRSKSRSKSKSKSEIEKQPEFDESSSGFGDMEMPELPVESGKSKAKIDLRTLLAQSAIPNSVAADEQDFGDEAPLSEQQALEKARKKKSLRFYTSQIVQKANKRGAASRDAGGDDDVPHKERLRDKQARLLKEAEKRGQQKATAEEQLDDESEPEGPRQSEGSYYESLVTESKQKKAAKKAKADAYAEAARQGAHVYEEEQIGPDGKRKITYAIEKNKGLAPKRKKDVRNPRVKKRKKFDEKMKKLGSVRQVYKGGEGRGGYGGELTGIKTNVVKSVKL